MYNSTCEHIFIFQPESPTLLRGSRHRCPALEVWCCTYEKLDNGDLFLAIKSMCYNEASGLCKVSGRSTHPPAVDVKYLKTFTCWKARRSSEKKGIIIIRHENVYKGQNWQRHMAVQLKAGEDRGSGWRSEKEGTGT